MKPMNITIFLVGYALLFNHVSVGYSDQVQLNDPTTVELKKVKEVKQISYQVEVYLIPSSSTFFWDKSLINFKRKNPMGSMILRNEQAQNLIQVIGLQDGKKITSNQYKVPIRSSLTIPDKVNDNQLFMVQYLRGKTQNNIDLQFSYRFISRYGPNIVDTNKLMTPWDFTWSGNVPFDSTICFISRSKDLKRSENYAIFVTPSPR